MFQPKFKNMFFIAPHKKAAKEMCQPNFFGVRKIKSISKYNEMCVGVWYEMHYWSSNQKMFMRDAKLCDLEIHFVKFNGQYLPVAVGDLSNLKSEAEFKQKFSKKFNDVIAYVKS